jgi:plasmid stabilization system protein ParE
VKVFLTQSAIESHGVRRRPVGDYLIFYRVAADRVEVVHVLHGARDYEALLFPPA